MKKNYSEPEMELIKFETVGFLAASDDILEEPAIGGSEAGYSDPGEFDPS